MDKTALDTLLEAASLAPSGDNTQPWRFTVNRADWTIAIEVDPERDPSPMNVGQRMADIAVGAAVENMIQTAEGNGWEYQLSQPSKGSSTHFRLSPTSNSGQVNPLLLLRATNRRVYRGGEITAELRQKLESSTTELDGVRAHWILDNERLLKLSGVVSRADAVILGTKAIRNAFLKSIRFDKANTDVVDEGLSLGSLEAGWGERKMLRAMRAMPDSLFYCLGGRLALGRVSRQLMLSASGVCVVSVPELSSIASWRSGRVWQRAWLALTEHGMVAQPMMSLLILQNLVAFGTLKTLSARDQRLASELLQNFRRLLTSELNSALPCTLMRIGYADQPTGRVGRMPIAKMTADTMSVE
ncbi:nitroreductase family protein [Aureliella helgolandensis]|uniref:Uncharacterized protein n=1 Tax=Aureliella helgolandensis TaxID=2527968 RepID=A0A518GE09_9BACT|nr:nitroreductase family protein [Aureliella helgolandensis]QDV26836.1 hypothetical protein Q31a_52150 [Aureliella helgolandensis]